MKKLSNTDHKSVKTITKFQTAIINATLTVFLKNGIISTTADDIAKVAGISKSTIFYHFGSLEDLYNKMFRYFHQQIQTEMYSEIESVRGTEKRLEHLWFKRAKWGLSHPDEMRFIYTRYALYSYKHIDFDRALIRIISDGRISGQLANYNTTQIAGLFYSGNNSIILSVIFMESYFKKKITMIRLSFESFYETIKYKEKDQEELNF